MILLKKKKNGKRMIYQMARPRYNPAPDANQPAIVAALRKAGYHVIDVSGPFSTGDLFVWGYDVAEDRMCWRLLEVKTPEGKLTPEQREFMAAHPGAVQLARTPEEALSAFGRVVT